MFPRTAITIKTTTPTMMARFAIRSIYLPIRSKYFNAPPFFRFRVMKELFARIAAAENVEVSIATPCALKMNSRNYAGAPHHCQAKWLLLGWRRKVTYFVYSLVTKPEFVLVSLKHPLSTRHNVFAAIRGFSSPEKRPQQAIQTRLHRFPAQGFAKRSVHSVVGPASVIHHLQHNACIAKRCARTRAGLVPHHQLFPGATIAPIECNTECGQISRNQDHQSELKE
jgi:hypothetical protein